MQLIQARRHVRRADFRLAGWMVEPSADRISRGEEAVHLRPKLMDVLVFLVGRAGEVVTKDELLEAIWPQLFVEESAITRVIADLRQALGDDAHRPEVIETIPKRGYRLIAPVEDDRPATPAGPFGGPAPLPFDTRPSLARRVPVFVGRDEQLARLDRMLECAWAGSGSVAFVTGEVGTGKSALLAEFVRRAQRSHPDLVIAHGKAPTPGAANDPYAAFRQVLALVTGDVEASLAAGDLDVEQAERLWRLIPRSVQVLTDVAPDVLGTLVPVARLLGRARVAAAACGGDRRWLACLEQLVARGESPASPAPITRDDLVSEAIDLLQAISREHPVLLVFDDLQWADAASIGLLFQLAGEVADHRMLVIGAYRPADLADVEPGARHPLEAAVHELVRRFGEAIIPLPEQGDQAFVDGLVDAEPNRLGAEFRRTLLQQTRGHPLFTVELLRAMRQAGALLQDAAGRWHERATLDWNTLPARVEAAVAERVARLPRHMRRLLDAASIEGEEFTAEVVARVTGLNERETVLVLAEEVDKRHRLARLQSVTRVNDSRVSTYRFEHVVTARYLAGSLDQAQRAYLHEGVGRALETLYGKSAGEIAPRLAWHFEQAGVIPKAIEYMRLAGERALQLSADQEAAAHFASAITLLAQLPPSAGHDAAELQFQLALVLPLLRLTTGTAPALTPAIERVHELAARLPAGADTFSASTVLAFYHTMRGEYARALRSADRSEEIASELCAPPLVAVSRWLRGVVRLRTGALDRSRDDLESNLTPGTAPPTIPGFMHPQVLRACWLGYCLWFMGYPDRALACEKEAVSIAEQLGDRSDICLALDVQASVHLHRREGRAARDVLDAALRTLSPSSRAANDFLRVSIPYLQAWSLAEMGCVEEGLAHLERVTHAVRPLALRLDWTKFLATLAGTMLKAGRVADARTVVAEALAAAETTGERYYEPELHRLKGEALLAAGGPPSDAERCFREAIQKAREQLARSWELRATTSLARMCIGQGRRAEAQDAVSAVYGWFTEGFDTPDLQAAHALLHAD